MNTAATAQKFIEFDITQSSIDHGRIYFSSVHTDFFPADVIGGRGKNEHASNSVHIEAAGEIIETDIRRSSAVRISPRKSFKFWLQATKATNGAKACLYRLSERQYRLQYRG